MPRYHIQNLMPQQVRLNLSDADGQYRTLALARKGKPNDSAEITVDESLSRNAQRLLAHGRIALTEIDDPKPVKVKSRAGTGEV